MLTGRTGRGHQSGVAERVEEFARQGNRTLGVAFKKPEDEAYHLVGLLPFFDPPRDNSAATALRHSGWGLTLK